MPRFNYTAISVDGKKVKGTVTSESPYAARKQLRSKGMHPSSVREFTSQEERKAAFLSLVKKGGKKQNKKVTFEDTPIKPTVEKEPTTSNLYHKLKVKTIPSSQDEHTQLLKDLETLSYVKVGKKYGVSDNGVRKWLKLYDKYDEKIKMKFLRCKNYNMNNML